MLSVKFRRKAALAEGNDVRMLTDIPTKDWATCDAVPATLSSLLGAIVPGHLRKVDTVFEVSDLQVLGISSVKSETDEWLIPSCKRCKRAMPCQKHPGEGEEKRLAVRLTIADGNSQCAVMVYHDMLLRTSKDMEMELMQESLVDDKPLRQKVRDMFRNAQWLCRFTFKENDFQQVMELECRDMRACLKLQPSFSILECKYGNVAFPHCRLNDGCPVVALQNAVADPHLGMISVGKQVIGNQLDANFVRAVVRVNTVALPDSEAVQHDQSNNAAMRVKRAFDCLLSDQKNPTQVKLRAAGPVSVVNWMLQGRAGDVHAVVLSQTDQTAEWNVLWHVPVDQEHVGAVKEFFARVASLELETAPCVSYDNKWTPVKRIHCMRDALPEIARTNPAWTGTLPDFSDQDATMG